ncbi:MAG TPA: type II toxin-antitoxin system Phd/YefM family antitoxin [Bdellovibrionota bacterium]|nr:type II toxin-antitoxin system Phd/YefM family antitoxin [Bdellovibrionota bacterium]
MKAIAASQLRQNIYRLLDRILQTGIPLEIVRRGKRLRISALEPPSKLASLPKRRIIKGNPEDMVHLDWSGEWKPERS